MDRFRSLFGKKNSVRYGRVVMLACVLAWSVAGSLRAQEGWLTVHADQTLHPLSRTLTGACLEDVNHEVYGGIDSQMLYGESFQEPAPLPSPLEGFKAWGGDWKLENGELTAKGENGPKLVRDAEPFSDGEVGVEILLPDRSAGNAGLILKVNRPGVGADNFDGYEISLDAALQIVRLGRHRHNWEHIRDIPCEIPTGGWIPLKVQIQGPSLKVWVQDQCVLEYEEQNPLKPGTVGLRPWGREVRYRNLWVRPESKDDGPIQKIPFTATRTRPLAVSGMWRAIKTGTALGEFSLETGKPFSGVQSQRLSFKSGEGSIGIENQGLNRWGLNLLAGKVYEGFLYVRAEKPVELTVALESRNGRASYDEKHLAVTDTDWKRVDFTLTPTSSDPAGRFALRLDKQGSVSVGYAFLQPGDWGRFKGLPVRRDVAEGLIEQGITVLRYGGCMANAAEYRWKKMIGPRENRPPYKGWWYPYSSNGWGIVDFMNFCEAAGFEYIPDFNASETPQDMVDFIEYAKGPADSEWGKRRVADGHPAPYRLRYLQIGNEERVDQRYFDKFKPTAEAIWAKDPEVILVVGDFQYTKPITDPMKFEGSVVGITSLTAQSKILDLARAHNREVWFDLHVNTEGPRPDASLEGMRSFTDALEKLANGARHKVVVFELNAGNHAQKRALANALAIGAIARDGRIPMVASANCLQPDGQNDNDWNQGLLFLDPSTVWLQPPGYVIQMLARHFQPEVLKTDLEGPAQLLDVTATRSEDGKVLILRVVNPDAQSVSVPIHLPGFQPSKPTATGDELAGPLEAANTRQNPKALVPRKIEWKHEAKDETTAAYSFAPHSFTILRFE